jgi:hypothetical protein
MLGRTIRSAAVPSLVQSAIFYQLCLVHSSIDVKAESSRRSRAIVRVNGANGRGLSGKACGALIGGTGHVLKGRVRKVVLAVSRSTFSFFVRFI